MFELNIPGVEFVNPRETNNPTMSHIIYGPFQAGKSYLMGDAIAYYKAQGKTCMYLAIGSEDPSETLKHHDIGDCFASITTLEQYHDVMAAIGAGTVTLDVIALDSIKKLFRIVMDDVVGLGGYPTDGRVEWPLCHNKFGVALAAWKEAATISLATCPATLGKDHFKSPDQYATKDRITPDLAGSAESYVAGEVQFIGYLDAELDESTSVTTRTLDYRKSNSILTRTDGLSKPITDLLTLPDGPGAWDLIVTTFDAHRGTHETEIAKYGNA